MTDIVPAAGVADPERQAVLDDLSLAMLFLDAGSVTLEPDLDAADPRVVRARIVTHDSISPVRAAAMLCRLLHNMRVPGVRIERDPTGVRLLCDYVVPSGVWKLELFAPA